jgi:hypothetical protein
VFREISDGRVAHALATRWRGASEGEEWKDMSTLLRRSPKRDDQG